MLAAALPLANEIGIDPALITCDVSNKASRSIILRAGGVLVSRSSETLRFPCVYSESGRVFGGWTRRTR